MGRRLKYPPRKTRDQSREAEATHEPLFPRRFKPPKWRRLKATFMDEEDGRYASINGIIYPALLTSCLTSRGYNEDMRDSVDYPVDWCRRFVQDLNCRAAAILVSDADEERWKFLGLFQVEKIQLSSFLTCRIGAKLAKLQLLSET